MKKVLVGMLFIFALTVLGLCGSGWQDKDSGRVGRKHAGVCRKPCRWAKPLLSHL